MVQFLGPIIDSRTGSIYYRLGLIVLRLGNLVIEPKENISLCHHIAFFYGNVYHLATSLR